MRAPNGYGQIVKNSGKRRKPWQVRVTVGYRPNDRGSLTPIYKTVGFYEKYNEAVEARAEYNREKDRVTNKDYMATFAEVYEMWAAERLDKLSRSARNNYIGAYKKLEKLYPFPIKDITYLQLQDAFDKAPGGPSSKSFMKTLLKQMWEFADLRGMVSKNIAEGLRVEPRGKSTAHFPFTPEDVATLWEHQNDDLAAFCLILVYTGMRPGELFNMPQANVDLATQSMRVTEGKNQNALRTVPIPDKVLPLVEERMDGGQHLITMNGQWFEFSGPQHDFFMKKVWRPGLAGYGILTYTHPESGKEQNHTPHDCRHTFTTQWKKQGLNELHRCVIQGHSLRDIGSKVYTHLGNEELLAEINKLIYLP